MSQVTDYTLESGISGANQRSQINDMMAAINTLNSGTTAPDSKATGSLWLDTTSSTQPILKSWDGSDWITIGTFNYTANTFSISTTVNSTV